MKILISSFDKYSDLWPVFFQCKQKYWQDCTYTCYLVSNTTTYNSESCESICTGTETNWCDRMEKALERIDDDYILLLLEDYLFGQRVDNEKIKKYEEFCVTNSVDYLRLIDIPHKDRFFERKVQCNSPDVFEVLQDEEYGVNLQPAIWRRTFLLDVLKKVNGNRSAWEVECYFLRKTECAESVPMDGCYTTIENVLNVHNGILKGKWFPDELSYFRRNGIVIEPGTRPQLTQSEFVRYKTKLFFREMLSSRQRRIVKRFLRNIGVKFASDRQ